MYKLRNICFGWRNLCGSTTLQKCMGWPLWMSVEVTKYNSSPDEGLNKIFVYRDVKSPI